MIKLITNSPSKITITPSRTPRTAAETVMEHNTPLRKAVGGSPVPPFRVSLDVVVDNELPVAAWTRRQCVKIFRDGTD